jgi:hypothetical protein
MTKWIRQGFGAFVSTAATLVLAACSSDPGSTEPIVFGDSGTHQDSGSGGSDSGGGGMDSGGGGMDAGGGHVDSGGSRMDAGGGHMDSGGGGMDSSAMLKAFGDVCTVDGDCQSGLCRGFVMMTVHRCTLACTSQNAATICVAPSDGTCNGMGYCKFDQ